MEQHKQQPVADVMDILDVLPHRYPMLLIDSVLEYEAGRFAVTKKAFTYNEPFFQGHYPRAPIVPGTVQLESLSQAATFAILSDTTKRGKLLFTGVNKLRFFKTVFPGDSLLCRVEIMKERLGLIYVNGEGVVDGKVCISAEMTFVRSDL